MTTPIEHALLALEEAVDSWKDFSPAPDDVEIYPGVFQKPGEHEFSFIQCLDCKAAFPMEFMVRNELWAEAGLKDARICLPCLETRLRRRVTIFDLKHIPMNEALFRGYLMRR